MIGSVVCPVASGNAPQLSCLLSMHEQHDMAEASSLLIHHFGSKVHTRTHDLHHHADLFGNFFGVMDSADR